MTSTAASTVSRVGTPRPRSKDQMSALTAPANRDDNANRLPFGDSEELNPVPISEPTMALSLLPERSNQANWVRESDAAVR